MGRVINGEEGRITLPKEVIEKCGKEFRIVERENVIDLKTAQTENRADN